MKDNKSIFKLVLNTVSKLPWWKKASSSHHKHMKPGKEFNQPILTPPSGYLKELSDDEFKELVVMVFKQRGYNSYNQNDEKYEGVDLVLQVNNEITFVNFSEWRKQQVGVTAIAQLYVSMKEENAKHGIIVTTGIFTSETLDLALGKAILLINGIDLSQMVDTLQSNETIQENDNKEPEIATEMPELDPLCPICSQKMIKRTARKGKNAGNTFWGCSTYPNCRGVVNN